MVEPFEDADDDEVYYELNLGDDPELVEAELHILRRLTEAVTARVGLHASLEARQAAFLEITAEDPELHHEVIRMQELSRCHSHSILDGLVKALKEEEEEEERQQGGGGGEPRP
jgi:hypothetical protein